MVMNMDDVITRARHNTAIARRKLCAGERGKVVSIYNKEYDTVIVWFHI